MTRFSYVRIAIGLGGVAISAIALVSGTATAQSGITPIVPAAQATETTTTTTDAPVVSATAPTPRPVVTKPAAAKPAAAAPLRVEKETIDIAVDPENGVIDTIATGKQSNVEIGEACTMTKNADGTVTTSSGCSS